MSCFASHFAMKPMYFCEPDVDQLETMYLHATIMEFNGLYAIYMPQIERKFEEVLLIASTTGSWLVR